MRNDEKAKRGVRLTDLAPTAKELERLAEAFRLKPAAEDAPARPRLSDRARGDVRR